VIADRSLIKCVLGLVAAAALCSYGCSGQNEDSSSGGTPGIGASTKDSGQPASERTQAAADDAAWHLATTPLTTVPGQDPYVIGPELSVVEGVSIRRVHQANGGFLGGDAEGYVYSNVRFLDVLTYLCPDRMDPSERMNALPSGRFDVRVKVEGDNPDGDDSVKRKLLMEGWNRLVDALEKTFGARIIHDKREVEYQALTLAAEAAGDSPAAPAQLTALVPKGTPFIGGGIRGLDFNAQGMERLAKFLSDQEGIHVFDETGLKGQYSFSLELPWRFKPAQAATALRKIGLDQKIVRRQVEAWFVDKAPPIDAHAESSR